MKQPIELIHNHLIKSALAISIVALTLSCAHAANSFWDTTGTGNWHTPANWTVGVPGAADGALIRNGGTAVIATGSLAEITTAYVD